ncbi:MAG: calcium/sodium antiporter [Parvularculaceae bacterium]
MDWLSIAGGLVVLTLGAELLIRGATAIARRYGVSDLLIGLTLVGFGTSTPELVSSIQAAFMGSPGVAVGNVVGSNIANILLILGLSAFIAPFDVERKAFRRDGVVVLAATLLAIAVSMTGVFDRAAGAGFLAAITLYIAYAFVTERSAPQSAEAAHHAAEGAALPAGPKSPMLDLAMALAGLVLLVLGAKFLVTGAISVAASLGVSETVIGLTVVAIGTSLPELVTSSMAALRGKSGLALGNVVGSNIYNLLGILGATALIHPVAAPARIVVFDNWVMLAATLAMILFVVTRNRLNRLEGAALVAGYGAYLTWLVIDA